jgi:energy-coupling factor transporter ATP-binding protein EcfA2
MQSKGALVRLDSLSFTYEDASEPSLRGISLELGSGSVAFVIGLEGAGKTSLFRALNGSLLEAYPGRFEGSGAVCGLDLLSAGHKRLGLQVASIFDDPDSQITNLTVFDEVAYALVQRGVDKSLVESRVAASLGAVGLSGFEERAPSSLSGGQKQRLVTACAFALEPDLILLDESSSALDPLGSRALYQGLRSRVEERGLSVIAIETDLSLALEFADRVLVMAGGRLLYAGSPEGFVSDPALVEASGLELPDWLLLAKSLLPSGSALPASAAAAAISLRAAFAHAPRPSRVGAPLEEVSR